MALRGRANYRNLSRYSGLHEKTYSRWFGRHFDFVEFNRLSLAGLPGKAPTLIAALDGSFNEKSGKHAYGLGTFYHSSHSKPEKGLEIATLAVVDVEYNTAYTLSTRQTSTLDSPDETRLDGHLSPLAQDCHALAETVDYLVTDGYYSKKSLLKGS